VDETWAHLIGFQAAYRETMTRVAAADYYFFSDQYFTELRAALGERLHLFVVERGGRVAAAALFTQSSGIVQYHLSATRDEFLSVSPMKLLLHFARTWFKERGCTVMHLGGGVGVSLQGGIREHARTLSLLACRRRAQGLRGARGALVP
jgi:hypothetical protein